MTYRNPKIMKFARGRDCTFMSPVCNHDANTSVWCHSNYLEDGKGMGTKAHDAMGFIGCSACHDLYDGRATYRHFQWNAEIASEYFHKAMKRSWRLLLQEGVLK